MSTVSPPFTIRNARLDEFDTIGRLHRTAMASDAAWQLLNAKADPEEWRRWIWDDKDRSKNIAEGNEIVLVLECADRGQVIGLTRLKRFSAAYPPTNSDPQSYPRGVNQEESAKLAVLGLKWQTDLLRKYGEFIREHSQFRRGRTGFN